MLRVRHMKVKLTMAHTKFYFFIRNAFDLWSNSPLFTLRPRLSSDSRGSERSEALTSLYNNLKRTVRSCNLQRVSMTTQTLHV